MQKYAEESPGLRIQVARERNILWSYFICLGMQTQEERIAIIIPKSSGYYFLESTKGEKNNI